MSVTLDVSQFDRSNDDNDEQVLNMPFMFVTLDVSQFDTSNDDNLEQPWNMRVMFVTFPVSILSRLVNPTSPVKPENSSYELSGKPGYVPSAP